MSPKTALLVIDVQESFRHRPYFKAEELPSFFDRLQKLCDGAKNKGWPVVQVFHVEDSGVFSEASGHVKPMRELELTPATIIKKTKHSALAGTPLLSWLTERGIQRVVVCGIRTEQCCETTTRHASDSGLEVDFVTEATLTFPIALPNGRELSTADIRERTEAVLRDRFARVLTVDEVLA
jgi:nicotinamidase-related amidase